MNESSKPTWERRPPPLLGVNDLTVSYGSGIRVLEGISLFVGKGEIVALIGPNGAGKTTTLRAIFGMIAPEEGVITFRGESLEGKEPAQLAAMGITYVPEGGRIFPSLTVMENLEMGAFLFRERRRLHRGLEKAFHLFPRLVQLRKHAAVTLSGGEQQMLAIARGLMSDPLLLMLDEPSLGLFHVLVNEIFEKITEINQLGVSILLVEQNARKALQICQWGYVYEIGRIALEDTCPRLLANQEVRVAYLGD